MTSRFRLALILGSFGLAGCGDAFNAGPIPYAESERLNAPADRPDSPGLAGKPKLQAAVRKAVDQQFGPDPREIRVPPGSKLPYGGRRLAGRYKEGAGDQQKTHRLVVSRLDPATWTNLVDARTKKLVATQGEGGYTLYRRHCLHCHGVSGDGAGPTADFLFPRPRDYRKGVYKFTSTATGAKPTRDDLRRTIRNGLVGTSMPAFDSLMAAEEIEQVVDYVIFLSMRGEVEQGLIDEALIADENDANPLSEETIQGVLTTVITKWATAAEQVLDPPTSRTASTDASIGRGKELFLGRTSHKLECAGCHGPQALGNGPSFVDSKVFDRVVFGGDPVRPGEWRSPAIDERLKAAIRARYNDVRDAAMAEAMARTIASGEHHGHPEAPEMESFESFLNRNLTTWRDGSFDDWGMPMRPTNLNLGMYKGGRRPIDLYWRIAKGINGAKMPAHGSTLKPEEIWDLVNFVLDLPYRPGLLRDAGPVAPASAVARR